MVYTLKEVTEIVILYWITNENDSLKATLFNKNHPNRNVSVVYVGVVFRQFLQTGSVNNKKMDTNKCDLRDKTTQLAIILGHINLDPELSLRKLSEVSGVPKSTYHKILKLNKMLSYKIQLHLRVR